MNREKLLQQINKWHEKDEYQKIIDAIEALPQEEWGYELTCLLALAYNNVSPEPCEWQLEKAVSLLESVREDGKDDARWHFRLGYALYYLDREAEALPCFRRAAELGDPDTQYFIEQCENAIKLEYENRENKRTEAELKEKALELADHLNHSGIVSFENFDMLGIQDFENIVLLILQELQSQYPHTKIKQRMKSVHYANGFTDEVLQNCAFMFDDIEEYLTGNKFMNHNASVRYFNKRITTNGFDINPKSLVLVMMDSLLYGISGGVQVE